MHVGRPPPRRVGRWSSSLATAVVAVAVALVALVQWAPTGTLAIPVMLVGVTVFDNTSCTAQSAMASSLLPLQDGACADIITEALLLTSSTYTRVDCTNNVIDGYNDAACQTTKAASAALGRCVPSLNIGRRFECGTYDTEHLSTIYLYGMTDTNCVYPTYVVVMQHGVCSLGNFGVRFSSTEIVTMPSAVITSSGSMETYADATCGEVYTSEYSSVLTPNTCTRRDISFQGRSYNSYIKLVPGVPWVNTTDTVPGPSNSLTAEIFTNAACNSPWGTVKFKPGTCQYVVLGPRNTTIAKFTVMPDGTISATKHSDFACTNAISPPLTFSSTSCVKWASDSLLDYYIRVGVTTMAPTSPPSTSPTTAPKKSPSVVSTPAAISSALVATMSVATWLGAWGI